MLDRLTNSISRLLVPIRSDSIPCPVGSGLQNRPAINSSFCFPPLNSSQHPSRYGVESTGTRGLFVTQAATFFFSTPALQDPPLSKHPATCCKSFRPPATRPVRPWPLFFTWVVRQLFALLPVGKECNHSPEQLEVLHSVYPSCCSSYP